MGCCGNNRAAAGNWATRPPEVRFPPAAETRRTSVAYFQHAGATGIIVTGPATGRRYRFDKHGAILAVALADRAGLAMLPQLRQVAGP